MLRTQQILRSTTTTIFVVDLFCTLVSSLTTERSDECHWATPPKGHPVPLKVYIQKNGCARKLYSHIQTIRVLLVSSKMLLFTPDRLSMSRLHQIHWQQLNWQELAYSFLVSGSVLCWEQHLLPCIYCASCYASQFCLNWQQTDVARP